MDNIHSFTGIFNSFQKKLLKKKHRQNGETEKTTEILFHDHMKYA